MQETTQETQPNTLQVFLVEDNPADTLLVREALKEHGLVFDLNVANNGEKAIDFIERLDKDETQPCPGIVLLDLNLPRHSGEEVLERLIASTRCGKTPTVIITSSDDPSDRATATRLGVTHYFRKPTELTAFMALGGLVRRLVEKTAASAS